jgi:hypothetical protein
LIGAGGIAFANAVPGVIHRLIPGSPRFSVEKWPALADASPAAMQKTSAMTALLDDEEEIPGDIDMDRVVVDPLYRRTVIDRLRRERLDARQRRDAPDAASDDED